MSLKVYTAYKLKRRQDFWPLIRFIRRRGKQKVQQRLRHLYSLLTSTVDTHSGDYKRRREYLAAGFRENADRAAQIYAVSDLLKSGYRLAAASAYRDPFNFDVSVTFREDARGIYLIPYCDGPLRNVLNFLAKSSRLWDYHYQNQTDQPDNISNQEWRERRAVWNKLTESTRWLDYLVLPICCLEGWGQIDPMRDMLIELRTVPG